MGGDCDEMLGYGRDVFAAQTGEQPTLCRCRVGEGLEGGERLGCDDEERRLRIEVVELSDQIDRSMLETNRTLIPASA